MAPLKKDNPEQNWKLTLNNNPRFSELPEIYIKPVTERTLCPFKPGLLTLNNLGRLI